MGKGIALGLGEADATVYVTGRTTGEGESVENLPGTIYQTAAEVTRLGGEGIALPCNHLQDGQVEAAFGRVVSDHGALDILVNNVWGGYEQMSSSDGEFTWTQPFWEQPRWRWDAMLRTGLRAAFVASAIAAPTMIARQSGLIVNVSFWSAQTYMNNIMYGVSKAATDRLTVDMARELRPHQVAAVSLYPGLVRTERVMRDAQFFDLSNSESPRFSGRAVAALANDALLMQKSGQVLVAAVLAQEYGFTDVDGKQPRPLTLQDFSA